MPRPFSRPTRTKRGKGVGSREPWVENRTATVTMESLRDRNQFATFAKLNQSTSRPRDTASLGAGQPARLGRLKPILTAARWRKVTNRNSMRARFSRQAQTESRIFGPTTDRRLPPRNCLPARKDSMGAVAGVATIGAGADHGREDHDPAGPDANDSPPSGNGRGRGHVECPLRSSSRRRRHWRR